MRVYLPAASRREGVYAGRTGRKFLRKGEEYCSRKDVEGIDFDAFFLLNVSEYTKCYLDIKGEVTEDA